jgi:predicted site-specific integrase-resolvase
MYVSAEKASEYYNVTTTTLRRWSEAGKIKYSRTSGKHRRYYVPDPEDPENPKLRFCYARVSSSKQKSDLQNQIKFLKNRYPDYEIISDIGSGINFKRPGFNRILEQVFDNNVEEVVVASPDRLVRFSFDLIQSIFDRFDAKLTVINDESDKTYQEELAEDLFSVVTVFSARYHGKRKYTRKSNSVDSIKDKSKGKKSEKKVKIRPKNPFGSCGTEKSDKQKPKKS